ncbi:hypothetical protein HK100_003212, partial [Physocladia obscura]
GHKVKQDRRELQEQQALLDLKDHRDYQDRKDHRDHQDLKDQPEIPQQIMIVRFCHDLLASNQKYLAAVSPLLAAINTLDGKECVQPNQIAWPSGSSKRDYNLATNTTLARISKRDSTPFLGEISLVAFDFAPVGWEPAQGQLLSIEEYTALFALLGTTYGGDGRQTFALPNLDYIRPCGLQYIIALVGIFPSRN